jgi:hypothetical protein
MEVLGESQAGVVEEQGQVMELAGLVVEVK